MISEKVKTKIDIIRGPIDNEVISVLNLICTKCYSIQIFKGKAKWIPGGNR